MSQFVAYANADRMSRKLMPYWLDVQSDLVDSKGVRVVVPLITPERAAPVIGGLMPYLQVAGKRMVMDTAQITNVPTKMLGKRVADLSRERIAIFSALDFLTHGI